MGCTVPRATLLSLVYDLAHSAGSFEARGAFAASARSLASYVVDQVRQMHVEMNRLVGVRMAHPDWHAAPRPVCVELFHKWFEEIIVVLYAWWKHSVESNIGHETAQSHVEIQKFRRDWSERHVLLDFGAVSSDSQVKNMLLRLLCRHFPLLGL
jgi:hypothetical protein